MKHATLYSTLFSCLYDQTEPVGSLGRGVHYSIFRSVEWLNVVRVPLAISEIHDFAVIWDEDHDDRVIRVIEQIYLSGLLSPVQFIGERKGCLAVIVAAKFYWDGTTDTDKYVEQLKEIVNDSVDDAWTVEVGFFDRSPTWPPHQTETLGLIPESEYKVVTYLRTIDFLWNLGTKPFLRLNGDGWPTSRF